VIDVKEIASNNGAATRHRLVISDGEHYMQAMLATQLNDLVEGNQLAAHCVIKLSEFICNQVQARKIVILLAVEVVQEPTGSKIGNPQNVEQAGAAPVQQQRSSNNAPSNNNMNNKPQNNGQQQQQRQNSQPSNPYNNRGGGGNGGGGGPVVRNNDTGNVQPIDSLNPYMSRWTIKARVTSKTEMKKWSNARGDGCLFSIDLLDQGGGEIRATFFKDAAEKFFDVIQEDRCFFFSGGRLKVANKQYTSIKNNYECTFDAQAGIRPAPEDDSSQYKLQFDFVEVAALEQVEPNAIVDIIGVITDTGSCQQLTSKAGKDLVKRDITIVDKSGAEVKVTFWGDRAQNEPERWDGNPVLAMRGCKVSDFGGRSIGTFNSTKLLFNPDIPEGHVLRGWYDQGGSAAPVKKMSTGGGGNKGMAPFAERCSLEDIATKNMGMGEKPDWITVKATVTFIKHDQEPKGDKPGGPWYHACPADSNQNYKVVEEPNGDWRCEKLNQVFQEKTNRYILPMSVTDHSGTRWMTLFDDEAKKVLGGQTADELEVFKAEGNESKFEEAFQRGNFQTFLMKCRVKAEEHNDEQRVKVTCVATEPIDFIKESNALIAAIEGYA
jgi:replication factor A1